MTDDRQLEALLRDGMAVEARPVVADAGLSERIIATAVLDQPPAERRLWQNWLVPAVAAVLVALLLGSVLLGTKLLHSSSAPPATHRTPAPSLSLPHTPSPSPSAPSASSGPTASGSGSGSGSTGSAPGGPGGPVPAGFTGYDLTWISADEGWALGTAPCASAPCTSIVRTTDGGQSWVGLPAPKAYLLRADTCASACPVVSGIRFVNGDVGYVYGPNAFFMTTDGGQSWSPSDGDGWALEAVGGSVLRVTAAQLSCAPGCRFQLQRSDPGQSDWTDVALPSGAQTDAATLSANGNNVVFATYGNPAGGSNAPQTIVFDSADGGLTWKRLNEPCPQAGDSQVNAAVVTVAPDASISAICQRRTQPLGEPFLVTSTDGGRSFVRHPAVPTAAVTTLSATSATNVLAGGDQLYRWDGSRWQVASGPGKPRFIGFETAQIGRVLADNGAWTTSDAGAHWRELSY